MTHPAIALIQQRFSGNRFDESHDMEDDLIRQLVDLATRAPSAYNLQNWRYIAVRATPSKRRLCELAYGQTKVSAAAVTFIVCGLPPDPQALGRRLQPFVDTGHMPASMAASWQDDVRKKYADPGAARDEAIRSASLGAATLIHAASALGLASSPMTGFDEAGVRRAFKLADEELPVMLVPVGRAAPGNWPQKPRRPLSEVLEIA
ncbi:nitroreductase family protein [uncultured Castellaniella sp.]|uniref:nitroreductase family protein n=1 Tax=uncultured Castellaniella sp. TaxID=647907 RepID=UPI0026033DCF|nr:nitroreductase family protein [uncultured Castellaniella sp.]